VDQKTSGVKKYKTADPEKEQQQRQAQEWSESQDALQ
jgi:hypothetical protein